ncbi:MAG: LacI family transcriptional regulator [Anaerolineae bacterium]|nr:LacI family transcriptional regulator [Anaerolineae bacterium]
MRAKSLTLEKIAELAGVSPATVSRVVNNYPHIRPEVRERVQQIITQTGFQPNVIARSLASDRSGIIGLVIPNSPRMVFTDPYFASLITGITQATNRSGLTLSLFLFHSKEEETRTIQSILTTGLLDGVIITADRKEDSFLPRFAERGLPFVLIGRPERHMQINYVDSDNVAGGYMAAEHLLKLGRRRVATIGSDQNTAGDDRYTGYRNALETYQFTVDPDLVAFGDFSMESGYSAMKTLLPQHPDGVFVASDTMALGALRAIREAGLRVPDDISVVGFDDLPHALQADPPLTTIQHPIEQSGRLAVELLSTLLNEKDAPSRRTILPGKLIIRASCGAESSA